MTLTVISDRCHYTLARPELQPVSPDQLYCNTPADMEAIRLYIRQARQYIATHDEEIVKLELIVQSLKDQRAEMSRSLEEHLHLAAPIRRLPVEVLGSIFQEVSRSSRPTERCDVVLQSLPRPVRCDALYLSTVCRLWRDITLSIPSLWSMIMVRLDDVDEQTAAIADLLLQRSKDSPLEIYLSSFKGQSQSAHSLASMIAMQGKRIHHLHIAGDLDPFRGINFSVPKLHALELLVKAPKFMQLPWLASAVQLDSINSIDWPNHRLQTIIPKSFRFSKVSSTKVTVDYPSYAIDLLSRFPRVQHAELVVGGILPYAREAVTTLSLQSLLIKVREHRALPLIFHNVNAPVLHTLRLKAESEVAWPHEEFSNFIFCSEIAEKVTTLSISGSFSAKDSAIIDSLKAVPNLTCLSLADGDSSAANIIDPALLLALVPHPDRSMLPRLKHLAFGLRHDFDRLMTVIDLVKSRSGGEVSPCSSATDCLEQVIVEVVIPNGQSMLPLSLPNVAGIDLQFRAVRHLSLNPFDV